MVLLIYFKMQSIFVLKRALLLIAPGRIIALSRPDQLLPG